MARTFRNTNSIAKGWVVRDDGLPYFNGWDMWGNETFKVEHGYYNMPSYRRSKWGKENTSARRGTNRAYRAQWRQAMRDGRYGDIVKQTRTSGWETL